MLGTPTSLSLFFSTTFLRETPVNMADQVVVIQESAGGHYIVLNSEDIRSGEEENDDDIRDIWCGHGPEALGLSAFLRIGFHFQDDHVYAMFVHAPETYHMETFADVLVHRVIPELPGLITVELTCIWEDNSALSTLPMRPTSLATLLTKNDFAVEVENCMISSKQQAKLSKTKMNGELQLWKSQLEDDGKRLLAKANSNSDPSLRLAFLDCMPCLKFVQKGIEGEILESLRVSKVSNSDGSRVLKTLEEMNELKKVFEVAGRVGTRRRFVNQCFK